MRITPIALALAGLFTITSITPIAGATEPTISPNSQPAPGQSTQPGSTVVTTNPEKTGFTLNKDGQILELNTATHTVALNSDAQTYTDGQTIAFLDGKQVDLTKLLHDADRGQMEHFDTYVSQPAPEETVNTTIEQNNTGDDDGALEHLVYGAFAAHGVSPESINAVVADMDTQKINQDDVVTVIQEVADANNLGPDVQADVMNKIFTLSLTPSDVARLAQGVAQGKSWEATKQVYRDVFTFAQKNFMNNR